MVIESKIVEIAEKLLKKVRRFAAKISKIAEKHHFFSSILLKKNTGS